MAWLWILIVIAAVALIAWMAYRYFQTRRLRGRFGDEYDRTVESTGGRRKAASELRERRKRRESFELLPLSPDQQARFEEQWRAVQARFVDHPAESVREGDVLVAELMRTRGYPMEDFDRRAADVSVDHPDVVSNYRAAHEIRMRSDNGRASTEDLRTAMQHYRSMFEELLGTRVSTMPQDRSVSSSDLEGQPRGDRRIS
jgi:hypothetical protein